jgi:hypothetical protein
VSPGSSITVATGTIEEILKTGIQEMNTPNAKGCATDRVNVIDSAFSATCTMTSISVLDGMTLTPGVYCFSTFSLNAGASVTLDGTGYESPQWVFVSETTFITGMLKQLLERTQVRVSVRVHFLFHCTSLV